MQTLFRRIFDLKADKNGTIKILDANTFKYAISNQKVQLIDVRSPSEFKSGAIEDAKNMDFYSGRSTSEFNKLDKQKPVYIYCQSGNRRRQTSKKLSAMGFKEINDLKVGILNYNQ